LFAVLYLPRRDLATSIEQILKPAHRQTLFPQPSVKTFRRAPSASAFPAECATTRAGASGEAGTPKVAATAKDSSWQNPKLLHEVEPISKLCRVPIDRQHCRHLDLFAILLLYSANGLYGTLRARKWTLEVNA